jgi:dTDP-glucose 4,6-dehydratase
VRVLVAGGAGFIGSHLCDALVARGDEVVAVDNLLTGRRRNVAHLDGHERFSFVEHDITEPMSGADWLDGPIDAVLDLASPASPDDFATLPLEILSVGSTGTRNLLDLACEHESRFLLASTSEVYGDPLVHPQSEDYLGNVDPIGPRSCYDEAKRFSEALTMAYHRVHVVDTRIVRIFNTYGERMRPNDGRVVSNFVIQALEGRPITLYGDGSRTRSFCYVADEVAGLMAVLDGDLTSPVNVGNPEEVRIRELADLVVELTDSVSEIIEVSLPPERLGDPVRRCPDIRLAQTALGWAPTTTLREGLVSTIRWFADQAPASQVGSGTATEVVS